MCSSFGIATIMPPDVGSLRDRAVILYDDRQVLAALLEEQDGAYHRSLAVDVMLNAWSSESERGSQALATALEDCLDLVRRGALSLFFDRHGACVGHVVAARLALRAEAPVLHHPALIHNRDLWMYGPPNWVVHFEARNGHALPISRRFLDRCGADVDQLNYVRGVRDDVHVGTWTPSTRYPREPSPVRSLWDHERTIFLDARREKVERQALLTSLAAGDGRSLPLRTAMLVCSWAYNLRQFRITEDASVLLIWAWCSPEGLARMRDARADHPAEIDWNAGNIPVLIATSGTDADVRAGVMEWMAALPDGSAIPHRLVQDRLFDRYGIEPL